MLEGENEGVTNIFRRLDGKIWVWSIFFSWVLFIV